MKVVARIAWLALGMVLVMGGMLGCGSPKQGAGPQVDTGPEPSEELRVGEQITVNFHNLPTPIAPSPQRIKEDGTITLHYVGSVKAAGLTPLELQAELYKLYIPKYYRESVSIAVEPDERFFFVQGFVKNSNRFPYTPGMTVLKAITAASDFTPFANEREVRVVRADGTTFIVDCKKAKQDPKYDRRVYPGDRIEVPKGIF